MPRRSGPSSAAELGEGGSLATTPSFDFIGAGGTIIVGLAGVQTSSIMGVELAREFIGISWHDDAPYALRISRRAVCSFGGGEAEQSCSTT